jgi:NAD(P)-dependent dehydrogenase (short-subunit alcohol dehydrogenase family)
MPTAAALFDLTGKIAVVTGASYGLGVTFAETLASAGAKVALAARSADKLQAVAEKIIRSGGTAAAFSCDVADPTQVAVLVQAVAAKWGHTDILVNNAGIAADAGAVPEKVPHDLFAKTVQVNLMGVWYCCRDFGAAILRRGKGGSIINIASISGMAGWRDNPPAYQATKAAVINLTRNLACSWGDRGVRVNAICPGWFPSELTTQFFGVGDLGKHIASVTPMRRLGNVEELIGPLLFLASEASSFVTGTTLVVDGGFSAGSGEFAWPETTHEVLAKTMPNETGKRIKSEA